jgi:hypothetical protein
MVRLQKYIVWFISASLVTAGVVYAVRSLRQPSAETNPEIVSCLKSNGLKFYGSYSCPNCLEQKKILGPYLNSILYIECTQNPVLCERAGIKRVPTWEFLDGSRHEGALSFNELLARVGCLALTPTPEISPSP